MVASFTAIGGKVKFSSGYTVPPPILRLPTSNGRGQRPNTRSSTSVMQSLS